MKLYGFEKFSIGESFNLGLNKVNKEFHVTFKVDKPDSLVDLIWNVDEPRNAEVVQSSEASGWLARIPKAGGVWYDPLRVTVLSCCEQCLLVTARDDSFLFLEEDMSSFIFLGTKRGVSNFDLINDGITMDTLVRTKGLLHPDIGFYRKHEMELQIVQRKSWVRCRIFA